MRILAIVFMFAAAAAAVWWFMVVPLLRQRDQYCQFYATLDAVHATRLYKTQMAVHGLKLRLFAWALVIAPALLAGLQFVAGLPLLPMLPEKYREAWPLVLSCIGGACIVLQKFISEHPAPVPQEVSEIEVPTEPDHPDVVMTTAGPQVLDVAPAPSPAPEPSQ